MAGRANFFTMAHQIGDWNLLRQVEQWGLTLTPAQIALFRHYLERLYQQSEQFNLTRVPPEQAVGRHLLDSLCLLAHHTPPKEGALLDVGTGAGLPGIPLKIARPDLALTLLDSHGKTVRFLRTVCQQIGLDAEVVQVRAEEWAHDPSARERFDWVVARAVASMPILAELLLPFVKVGGYALALKSAHEQEEINSAHPAVAILGATLTVQPITFTTEQGELTRLIACMHKQSHTPQGYPRRWSHILRSPLGGITYSAEDESHSRGNQEHLGDAP